MGLAVVLDATEREGFAVRRLARSTGWVFTTQPGPAPFLRRWGQLCLPFSVDLAKSTDNRRLGGFWK